MAVTGVSRRGFLRGAAGAAALGGAGVATAQSGKVDDYLSNTSNYDGIVDKTGKSEVTVKVGVRANNGNFGFGPPAIHISPGTTVTWTWTGKGGSHNVVHEGGNFESKLVSESGHTFKHTFESEGTYLYFCRPHKALGMKGAVVVGGTGTGGGGDGQGAQAGASGGDAANRPDSGVTTALEVTFAGGIVLALLAPFIHYYYRGREPPEVEFSPGSGESEAAEDVIPEAPEEDPVQELGHDEYDPVGTAALIVVYFLILVGLWLFMYFVEFLGGGPTVIG